MKLQTQLTKEKGYSQVMLDVDAKGQDWQGQVKVGNGAFYGLNYIQSVTPALSMGGEAFWLGTQRKSGIGFAARHATDKSVGTVQVRSRQVEAAAVPSARPPAPRPPWETVPTMRSGCPLRVSLLLAQHLGKSSLLSVSCFRLSTPHQVATTGLVSLTYVHNVSEKVHLASDFLYNWNSREATASVGYDYILRQCRLRGRVDSNGAVAAFLEERLNVGVNFLLSAEIDHFKKDYKFGFGMTVGE